MRNLFIYTVRLIANTKEAFIYIHIYIYGSLSSHYIKHFKANSLRLHSELPMHSGTSPPGNTADLHTTYRSSTSSVAFSTYS